MHVSRGLCHNARQALIAVLLALCCVRGPLHPHAYPAHAPFGGYKKSGFGRETHKMMLNSYRQTKNMLISYDQNKLGFF